MTSRDIIIEAERLWAERGWHDEDPRAQYLLGLIFHREDARRGLLSHITRLRGDLNRLEATLQNSAPLLNDLGELQQRPAAVEAAVGQFIAAEQTFRDYLRTFPVTAKEGD